MIAGQILKELLQKTLRNAVIENDVEPLKDSLHDRFAALLKKLGYNFEDLAKVAQSKSKLEQLDADTQVDKILQHTTTLGSTLDNIKFGGYR